MDNDVFDALESQWVYITPAPFSSTYRAATQEDWASSVLEEQVRATNDDDMDDIIFFDQSTPSCTKEGFSRL